MKIRPLQDRIIVRRIDEEEKTKGGIIIPDTAKEKPMEGKVLAVGNGRVLEDGTTLALDVSVGDRILFAWFENHGVSGGHRVGPKPEGNHHGKVVGCDDPENPKGLPNGLAVDPGSDVLEGFPHHEGGNAAGMLHVLDAPAHPAHGLGEDLPMLLG